jgi:hypothetical protein
MAYYPKNKIQTGLYSNGEYTLVSGGQVYKGPYYKLYNGKYFTGQTPNSPTTQEIIPIEGTDNTYKHSGGKSSSIPYSPLLPTPQDYKNGEFIRYFVCRRNQSLFVEINKTTFNQYQQKDPTISWKLYKPFSLFWVLTGDINQVAQTNKNVTKLIEAQEQVEGLSIYLKEDWTQYYKEKP